MLSSAPCPSYSPPSPRPSPRVSSRAGTRWRCPSPPRGAHRGRPPVHSRRLEILHGRGRDLHPGRAARAAHPSRRRGEGHPLQHRGVGASLNARTMRERLGTTWAIGETGAAGPTGNRYGDAAGHTCVAVVGPIERARTDRDATRRPRSQHVDLHARRLRAADGMPRRPRATWRRLPMIDADAGHGRAPVRAAQDRGAATQRADDGDGGGRGGPPGPVCAGRRHGLLRAKTCAPRRWPPPPSRMPTADMADRIAKGAVFTRTAPTVLGGQILPTTAACPSSLAGASSAASAAAAAPASRITSAPWRGPRPSGADPRRRVRRARRSYRLGRRLLAIVLITAAGALGVGGVDVAGRLPARPRATTDHRVHRPLPRHPAGARPADRVAWAWVPYGAIAPELKRAVLVGEDIDFFSHNGFELSRGADGPREGGTRARAAQRRVDDHPTGGEEPMALALPEPLAQSEGGDPHLAARARARQAAHPRAVSERGGARPRDLWRPGRESPLLRPARRRPGRGRGHPLAAALPNPAAWGPRSNAPAYLRRVASIRAQMARATFLLRQI